MARKFLEQWQALIWGPEVELAAADSILPWCRGKLQNLSCAKPYLNFLVTPMAILKCTFQMKHLQFNEVQWLALERMWGRRNKIPSPGMARPIPYPLWPTVFSIDCSQHLALSCIRSEWMAIFKNPVLPRRAFCKGKLLPILTVYPWSCCSWYVTQAATEPGLHFIWS